ncbi:hypothetical protein Dimus_003639, partial [Dionaea muscipula]
PVFSCHELELSSHDRLVEEADYRSTTELFSKKGDEKTLDDFIPKSESDFLEYAELVSHKLRPYEKSYHYIVLLKTMMRLSMTALKAADAKEIASSVQAIANEKLKAEKEANAGKKKTGADDDGGSEVAVGGGQPEWTGVALVAEGDALSKIDEICKLQYYTHPPL